MDAEKAVKPSTRGYYGMASLSGDQVLLFGGFDSSPNNETWLYTPPEPPTTIGGVAVPAADAPHPVPLMPWSLAMVLVAAATLGPMVLRRQRRSS